MALRTLVLDTALQLEPWGATGPTPLATPSNRQASPNGPGILAVTANSVANALSYTLYSSAASGGTYAVLASGLATPTYQHTGLGDTSTRYYKWQAIGDGTTYASSALSAAFSGTTQAAAGQPTIIVPQSADYGHNMLSVAEGNGVTRHSPLARYTVQINAPGAVVLAVDISAKIQNFVAAEGIGWFVGGVYQGKLTATSFGAKETINLTVPGSGVRVVSFSEGMQTRPGDSGEISGAYLTKITAPAGVSMVTVAPVENQQVFIGSGDSIMTGSAADPVHVDAMVPALRELRPDMDVIANSYGYRSIISSLSTTEDKNIERARLSAVLAKYTGRKVIWLSLMTNDYGLDKGSPTEYGTALNAVLTFLTQDHPTAEIYVQTALRREQEGPNGLGFTLDQYRSVASTIVGELNNPKVVLVPGQAILTLADLADSPKLHPSSSGHRIWANFIHERLGGTVDGPGQLFNGSTTKIVLSLPSNQLSAQPMTIMGVWKSTIPTGEFMEVFNIPGVLNLALDGTAVVPRYPPGLQNAGAWASNTEYFWAFCIGGPDGSFFLYGPSQKVQIGDSSFRLSGSSSPFVVTYGMEDNGSHKYNGYQKNVSVWKIGMSEADLGVMRSRNAKLPATGYLNYNDANCLAYSPLAEASGGQFANLADPGTPFVFTA